MIPRFLQYLCQTAEELPFHLPNAYMFISGKLDKDAVSQLELVVEGVVFFA